MPEPKEENNKEEEQNNEGAGQPQEGQDIFGSDGKPTEGKKEDKGNKEDDKGKEDKNYPEIPDDHPKILSLKEEIDKVKSEYGGNLSGQRQVIDKLEQQIKDLQKGKAGSEEGKEEEALFTDIKWSKDLSEEEREEMTDTEIKQMDEIAEMKTKQNEVYANNQRQAKEQENKKTDDLQALVKNSAIALVKEETGEENTDLTNEIIENVKQFNLEGLTDEQVKDRVLKARQLLPNYAPPKEKTSKNGSPVKAGAGKDDPFGVDSIIDEVDTTDEGNYSL